MKKDRPRNSKDFSKEELGVMLKWAGKKPIDEIVILVNSVGNHLRDKNSITKKGSIHGLSFRLAK